VEIIVVQQETPSFQRHRHFHLAVILASMHIIEQAHTRSMDARITVALYQPDTLETSLLLPALLDTQIDIQPILQRSE
jgi:hypothetical protein